jgi:hypothetical protein
MERHPRTPKPSISILLNRVEQIATASTTDSILPLFDQDTCVEYHHLFVAALHAYHEGLSSLHKKKGIFTSEGVVPAAQLVWNASRILRVYAFSPTIVTYFKVVHSMTSLSTNNDPEYLRSDDPEHLQSDDLDPEDLEEERELKELNDREKELQNPIVKAKRWLRLQVAHWAALDILSAYVMNKRSPRPSVSLLSARPHKGPSDIAWKNVIRNVIPDAAKSHEIIESIKGRMKDLVVGGKTREKQLPKRVQDVLLPFRIQEDPDIIPFCGTLHCEAVIASLAAYSVEAGAANNPDLLNLVEASIALQTLIRLILT